MEQVNYMYVPVCVCTCTVLLPRARMCKAGLSNWFCPSVRLSISRQNLGLIATTKCLNTSKRHSNNGNSDKIVHGVPEGGSSGLIRANFQLFVAVVLFPDCAKCTNQTGDEINVAEDTRS